MDGNPWRSSLRRFARRGRQSLDGQGRHPRIGAVVSLEERGALVSESHVIYDVEVAAAASGTEPRDVAPLASPKSRERREGARGSVVYHLEVAEDDIELSFVRGQSNRAAATDSARLLAGCLKGETALKVRAGKDRIRQRGEIGDEALLHGPDEPPRSRQPKRVHRAFRALRTPCHTVHYCCRARTLGRHP